MVQTLTVEEERRRKRLALDERARQPSCPDKYRAIAEWWRLHAEETAVPEQSLEYADNQDRLAADMEQRPSHYRRKHLDKTDYEWSHER